MTAHALPFRLYAMLQEQEAGGGYPILLSDGGEGRALACAYFSALVKLMNAPLSPL